MALNLKGISYTPVFVNLNTNENRSEAYTKINPLRTVPLLVHHTEQGTDVSIAQTLAALEYLDEAFPSTRPLLPPQSDLAGRAFVRTLATTIVADVQPVTSLRVQAGIAEIGGDRATWARTWMASGLRAYEAFLENKGSAGHFSYGDSITIADICLTAQLWNAIAINISLDPYPRLKQVFENMEKEKAVVDSYWQNQPDCPADQRA